MVKYHIRKLLFCAIIKASHLHIGTSQANCRAQYMTHLCLEISHKMRTKFRVGKLNGKDRLGNTGTL